MTTSSIVAKSAKVIDTLCASKGPLSFTRIMTLTGLPRSSTHRILSILLEERLVTLDPDRQTYQPGSRLVGWATSTLRLNNLPDQAAGVMEKLNDETGAHVALSLLEGESVLFIKTLDGVQPYRLAPRVGERSPIHVCAAGKIFLANLRPQKRETLLGEIDFERFTDYTLVTREHFEAELEQVRDSGYAICDREEFLQVVGSAAPVFGHQGDILAALSLWDITERHDMDSLRTLAPRLKAAAQSLSARLGYQATAA